MLVAIGAAFVTILLAARRLRFPLAAAALLGCVLWLPMLAGAKVGWWLAHLGDGSFLGGGLLLVPGLVATLVTAVVLGLPFKQHLGATSDVTVIALAIGVGVGRMGCFLAGCCFGKPTSLPWGVRFPANAELIPETMRGLPLHPTQLYFLAAFVLLGAALWWRGPKRRFPGELTLIAIAVFAVSSLVGPFARYGEAASWSWGAVWAVVALVAVAAAAGLSAEREAPARA